MGLRPLTRAEVRDKPWLDLFWLLFWYLSVKKRTEDDEERAEAERCCRLIRTEMRRQERATAGEEP